MRKCNKHGTIRTGDGRCFWCAVESGEIEPPPELNAPTKTAQSEQWKIECLKYFGRVLTGELAHWCDSWDGMPIDETVDEIQSCNCSDIDKSNIPPPAPKKLDLVDAEGNSLSEQITVTHDGEAFDESGSLIKMSSTKLGTYIRTKLNGSNELIELQGGQAVVVSKW